jgi:eukaryotic-like serine/threonine-protein kinase
MNATAVLEINAEDFLDESLNLTQTPMPTGTLQAFTAPVETNPFPKSGDEFYGFELVEELGRGAFARVFLAREHRLANRLVVLKIATKANNEPLRLAQLQHTNIVPIHTAFRAGPFQVVQMPYYGRQTLANVIDHVRGSKTFPAISGEVFSTAACARASTHRDSKVRTPLSLPNDSRPHPFAAVPQAPAEGPIGTHPLRAMLSQMTYPTAVISLMRRIADGLAFAHMHNILHLDLKPQNILLGDNGQPLLIDFNLARDRTSSVAERVGGTWPYMAPEAIQEYARIADAKSDHRTDLYALGVIFYQMLTCRLPFPALAMNASNYEKAIEIREQFVSDIHEHNPEVPHAVTSIIVKLLAAKPENRYQSVEQLCEDLQRQEESRPLKYAADRHPVERFQKWKTRNPNAMTRLAGTLVVLGLAVGVCAFLNLQANRNQLVAIEQAREFRSELAQARLDVSYPTSRESRKEGMTNLQMLTKFYEIPSNPNWIQQSRIQNLPEADRNITLAQLREAALLLAHAEIQEARVLTGAEQESSLKRAVQWNKHAEAILTQDLPNALWEQRAELAKMLDDAALAKTIPTLAKKEPTAEDLYLRAIAQVARGEIQSAIQTGTQLTLLAPDHYAGQALMGLCYHATGQTPLAIERYLIARPLAKSGKLALYNRAMLLHHLGKNDVAESDLDLMVKVAPDDYRGYQLRGKVRQAVGKHREAIEDYTAARSRNASAISIHFQRADCYDQLQEHVAAQRERDQALTIVPQTAEDHTVLGFHIAKTKPTTAIEHFDAAIKLDPSYLIAYQNKSLTLAEHLGEWELALDVQKRIQKIIPEYVPGMTARAVLMARLNRSKEAVQEISDALSRSQDAAVSYAAACVYAQLSQNNAEDRAKSLHYLRQAIRDGYRDANLIERDPDLKPLVGLPEFATALQLARDIVK